VVVAKPALQPGYRQDVPSLVAWHSGGLLQPALDCHNPSAVSDLLLPWNLSFSRLAFGNFAAGFEPPYEKGS